MEQRNDAPDAAPMRTADDAPRAYRAVFFDLDGTLLPMEIEGFLKSYFGALGGFVARRGLDAEAFSVGLRAGTKAMAAHGGSRLNAEAFWEAFFAHVDADAADWEAVLADFYERDFGAIGAEVQADPHAARAIETLARKGYPLVLATMPMFPRRAVEWRLAWAGVDSARFARLTTFDNSTSVKPKLAYYAENLAAAGVSGSEVLMVGNNTVEDLAAMQLGCDAFLVTDHLLDPTEGFDLSTVRHGSMEEFAAWVETLPACADPAGRMEEGPIDASATAQALMRNRVEGGVEATLEGERAFYAKAAPSAGSVLGEGPEVR